MSWKQALQTNGETAVYKVNGQAKAAVGTLGSGLYDCQIFGIDRFRKSKLTEVQVEEHLRIHEVDPNSNWY